MTKISKDEIDWFAENVLSSPTALSFFPNGSFFPKYIKLEP